MDINSYQLGKSSCQVTIPIDRRNKRYVLNHLKKSYAAEFIDDRYRYWLVPTPEPKRRTVIRYDGDKALSIFGSNGNQVSRVFQELMTVAYPGETPEPLTVPSQE